MCERFAVLAAIAFALSACGGGGSGSQSNMMGPMTSTEPGPPPMTGRSLGGGLTAGGSNPIHATTAADTRVARLADPSNEFRAYSASLRRNRSAGTAEISDRFSIASVRSDGNYGLHVTYGDREATPKETEISLPATLLDPRGTFAHEEMGYWLWALSPVPFNGRNYASTDDGYVAWIGSTGPDGQRVFAVYGLETPKEALPAGMATYSGRGYAEMFDNSLGDVGTERGRTRFDGDVTLNVDFADNSLTGRIDMTEIRRPGVIERAAFTGTGFDVTGGAIADGRFTAFLTGTDTDAAAPVSGRDESMAGFEGRAVGAFYGPAGGIAGGVFTAERDMDGVHRVMIGALYGTQASDFRP